MSAAADRFAEHLAAKIGTGAAAPSELLARVNAAFSRHDFAAVLAPDAADGAAAILAICSAEGWPVIPIGAGTWLDAGARRPAAAAHDKGAASTAAAASADPTRPPVLLSTVRLNRITEHEPADLVIGVQAGLSLERLTAALAAKQQWLPLDPAAAPQATIGAVAANASAGPLQARHGTPRDMVLGVEIATGDGRLLRFGGRVVKNVAGYDGVRLTVGSRGTLGLITALYVRVRGAARADRTLAVPCGAGEAGARGGAELALALRNAAECDAIELVSPAVAGRSGLGPPGWYLLVRLLGSEAGVTEGLERCHRIVSGGPPAGPQSGGTTAEMPSAVWESLARLEAGAETALRLTGPATGLADVAGALSARARLADAEGAGRADGWLMAAHAADGVIRLWRAEDGPDGIMDHDEPAEIAAGSGWTLRYDRTPLAAVTGPGDRRADRDAVRTLTGRLRAVFDPAGIMSGAAEA